MVETTVGRVIFNQHVPVEVGYVNALLTKRIFVRSLVILLKITNIPKTVKFLDDIKQLGFRTAFQGGLSFNIHDLVIPDSKEELLRSRRKVK